MWLFIEERKIDDAFVVMQCSSWRNAFQKATDEVKEYFGQLGLECEYRKWLRERELVGIMFSNDDLKISVFRYNGKLKL